MIAGNLAKAIDKILLQSGLRTRSNFIRVQVQPILASPSSLNLIIYEFDKNKLFRVEADEYQKS